MTIRRLAFGGITLVAMLGVVVAGVYWIEAEREIRILCGMMKPGTTTADMERMLGTRRHSNVRTDAEGGVIRLTSWQNFHTSECTITTDGRRVLGAALSP